MKIKIHGQAVLIHDNEGKLLQAFSYDTCLAARSPKGTAIVNVTSFSVTTSKHQSKVWDALGTERTIRVKAPMNAEPADLVRLASEVVNGGAS